MSEDKLPSKEYLETLMISNAIVNHNKSADRVDKHEKELHAKTIEREIVTTRGMELATQRARESLRPHRMYPIEIFYDSVEKVYVCRMPIYDVEEDLPNSEPICAFGDTPEQACDNFDHLWVHGPRRD